MIDQAVQTNFIRSVLFNGKTSYRIVKSVGFDDATILLPDTQVDTEEDDITTNTIITMKMQITCQPGKLQQTLQQFLYHQHEVDDIRTFIERKFNDLSQK